VLTDFDTYTGWLYSGARSMLEHLVVNPCRDGRFVLARDINNKGQIVGYGCDGAGVVRGARLDPGRRRFR